MNSKPPSLRSIAGSGTTFTPLAPQTDLVAGLCMSLTANGARPVADDDDAAVHLRVLDRHPAGRRAARSVSRLVVE